MRVSGGGHFKQKSIKSKFVSISLRDKLIFLFVGTLFVELLLFGCVMSFYLYINAKKNVSDNIDTTVTAVSEVMDQSFLVMENLVLELAASNGVQNWLDDSHYYDRENSEFYLRKTEFSRELNRILIYSNAKKLDVVEYAAVFNDGYLLDYVDVQSVGGNKVQREVYKAYEAAEQETEKYIYSELVMGSENVIFHIRRMRSDFERDVPLIIMVATNERDIASAIKTNIETAQNLIAQKTEQIEKCDGEKEEKKKIIQTISEQIGSTKSKADYEKQRRDLKKQRDVFLENANSAQHQFGDEVMSMFPQLLISKAVNDAKNKLNLQANKSQLPSGINRRLISYLLKLNTKTCICGRDLCDDEREHIRKFLDMMPPKSYSSMYQDFTKTAARWGNGYDKQSVEEIIKRVLINQNSASECEKKIKELDDSEKNSKDIEDLVVGRQKAEDRVAELDRMINGLNSQIEKAKPYLKKQMKDYDKLTEANELGRIATEKIEIMQEVLRYFSDKLDKESVEYSKKLQVNIQNLLDNMLTSRRNVSVSQEFAVRVTDSYNDESKSEGQFAVVSFAYIGGILKMLKDDDNLQGKEYPLVLDGPFSKLDPDQRQNVVNMLPTFAPQVIVFSKDDLHDVISKENIGRVWTIVSNDEKNVAKVEEGKLWR